MTYVCSIQTYVDFGFLKANMNINIFPIRFFTNIPSEIVINDNDPGPKPRSGDQCRSTGLFVAGRSGKKCASFLFIYFFQKSNMFYLESLMILQQ